MARWGWSLSIVMSIASTVWAVEPPPVTPPPSAPSVAAPPAHAATKPAPPDSAHADSSKARSVAAEPSPNEPGTTHERLKYYVGDWRFKMTHMLDATSPQVSEGTAHCKPILGGRFFETVTKATMGNQPFEALTISGFDNVTGEYFSMWCDNTTTGTFLSRGRLDEDETLLLTGRFADPKLGEVPYRMRTTVTGPDSYMVEMFVTIAPSTEEQKVMEATYTRVKP